jgi:uncharacterized protein
MLKMNKLHSILVKNKYLIEIIKILKDDQSEQFYVGAGVIAQTVWNYLFGNDLAFGIDDVDIVYFNNEDLSWSSEFKVIESLSLRLRHIPLYMDIKNQARVHLWYKEKFGYEISQITSIWDAIDRWPTTATAIGVKLNNLNEIEVYSSFGLDDLFSGTIRANKKQITPEIYNDKVNKWLKKWPALKIVPWE